MRRKKKLLRVTPLDSAEDHKYRSRGNDSWSDSLLPGSMDNSVAIDNTINRMPLWIIAVTSSLLLLLLFLQLFQLQVVEGERMRGIADGNRVRESVDFAPRGRILDRNGEVLADNTASFQLSATPYLLPDSESERQMVYAEIASILEGIDPVDIAEVAEGEGLDHPRPLLVKENIDRDTALRLEYNLPGLSGFSLDAIPVRSYKSDAALSHILGYVGRVSESELEDEPELYPLDFIGKSGIEVEYDHILRGENGVKETEVDSLGRPLRTLREIPTTPGEDIHLTIDYGLQKQLTEAIEDKIETAGVEKGAGVVMDPRSGEILASVSLPAYDNNIFSSDISSAEYESLISDPQQPMHNRVIEGAYPTGSTIKPFNLFGALAANVVDENTTIYDGGSITLEGGYTFRSWNTSGLGPMNARSALAMSSNIYFYTVAGGYRGFEGMGIETLNSYYRLFGLGERTGIDIPNEASGRIPDPEWKRETTGEGWYIGDTYLQAIGQGNLLASPLQLNRAYAAIVNGGSLITPHLLMGADVPAGEDIGLPSDHRRIVLEGLDDVISFNGTMPPSVFEDVGVDVSGKSGTAETDPERREPHSWFAAYAPSDDPEIVSVVLIEEARSNVLYSAPAIAETFEWYFRNR